MTILSCPSIRLLLVPPALLLMMSIISESGAAASDGHDVMMMRSRSIIKSRTSQLFAIIGIVMT